MHRSGVTILAVALLVSLGCQAVTQVSQTQTAGVPIAPSPLVSPAPALTVTPDATPSPQPERGFAVRYHPDGPLYAGDQVSLEVIAPPGWKPDGSWVQVQVQAENGPPGELGAAEFEAFGLGGRSQATLAWVWDTRRLAPGDYRLLFSIQPQGETWSESVRLLPGEQVPAPEPEAHWEMVETECCVLHYVTGTQAALDLEELADTANEQAQSAIREIGAGFDERIPITLLPRVVGHGGFATREIYISYLARNYASNDFAQVLHHEMIHLLDGRMGGELRLALLSEGLAVYLTRGHFKVEPLMPRAAILLDLGAYLPLAELADSFYLSQHEIGYLEGGAFIQFLVREYGWQGFWGFYRDIHPHESGSQSQAIDSALQAHFGRSLAELEKRFTRELYRLHLNPELYDDVRLTVAYFDTVRRYQQLLDPSAYFLTAWLPSGEEMRERGIVADYLRRPAAPENVALETMLVEADAQLRAGNYSTAARILAEINAGLERVEAGR